MLLTIFLSTVGMELLAQLPGMLGGGGLVMLAEVLRRAYTTKVRREEHESELHDRKDIRDNEDSRSFVTEARAERKSTMQRVEIQAAEITRLSVEVAKCTAKHDAMESRYLEKDRQLDQLTASLQATLDLVQTQREEIGAQELVIESQGRDIIGLHAELTQLKAAFNVFVTRSSGNSDLPPPPAEEEEEGGEG